jgi:trimethylamine--corrinoid protein Co-methyltransferase
MMTKYFEVLQQHEVEAIHESALRILSEVGVIFGYDPALEILKKAGCKTEGCKVFFETALVEELRRLPPSEFTLYGRNDAQNVVFNQDALIMIPCYGSPFVRDLDRGRREGRREDFINFTKLTQESPHLDMASTLPCEMTDLPMKRRTPEYIRTTLSLCEKPMVVSRDVDTMKVAFEQCGILYGSRQELIEKPRFISITDSLSPLSYDDDMLAMLIYCAQNGIPQRIGGLGLAGLTTPVTLAGSISQMTAEALAGIVLTQLIRPGVPVVINNSTSCADMKSLMLSVGAPESALVCIGTAQMARFYGLPCRSGGGISDAKIVDAQAGAEGMMNLLTAALTGTNYILHACGILEAYMVSSPEKFVIDEENCGIVKQIRKGIPVNDDTLAFDTIKKVGPQGAFLTAAHTFSHYRGFYDPRLYDRGSCLDWEKKGAEDMAQVANREWKRRVKAFVRPALPPSLESALDIYVERSN